jgi:enoyl-CoA hydratase/carnithine racemase
MTALGRPPLLVARDADTVRITMNRPERRNALSGEYLAELLAAFRVAGETDATGIVLAAHGPVFSAGHDFADVAARDLLGVRELLTLCTELMSTIESVPQVVIARVHGLATAASWWPHATWPSPPNRPVSRFPAAKAAGSVTPPRFRWPAPSAVNA